VKLDNSPSGWPVGTLQLRASVLVQSTHG
jgi:hypothetical protein